MTKGKLYPIVAPPGAGKNTISKVILQHLNDCKILGASQSLKEAGLDISTGKLLSDSDVNSILIDRIQQELQNTQFVFIDGYPRTVPQFKKLLSSGIKVSGIIILNLPLEIIESRITDRIVCPNCGRSYTKSKFKPPLKEGICDNCFSTLETRKDDDLATFKKRYDEYLEKTSPIILEALIESIPIHPYTTFDTSSQKVEEFLRTFLKF